MAWLLQLQAGGWNSVGDGGSISGGDGGGDGVGDGGSISGGDGGGVDSIN